METHDNHIEETINRIRNMSRTSKRTISYKCQKCSDTTWIVEQGIARRCPCFGGVKRDLFKESGMSRSCMEKTFKNFKVHSPDTKEARLLGVEYYKMFNSIKNTRGNSVAFLGQVGSGKTHLGCALAHNFIIKDIQVVYMPYRDSIMDMKQNILDSKYYNSKLRRYQGAEVLLIDDLYKGKVTESDINIMFEIINHRYLSKKPMIISSEKSMREIISVDEALGSRIYEMCKGRIVEIWGRENNYRLKEKEEK